jgi:zinc protease
VRNNKIWRAALGAALFAIAGCAVPGGDTQWPHSDIPPDPAVRFGVLDNGMRYAILANHTPAGALSVRFTIEAGSMQEAPDQRGLAHFVEHLAFRGSAHFPDGEIDKSLQRLGLRFGSDTNASTSQVRTTYQFDLPRADAQSLDTALSISRDVAGNLDLSEKAVATESGVILSELKLRDTPSYRALVSEMDFELGDPHATAMPGGDPAIVAAAPIARIRDFYHAFYRPERAVLVVVGDIDPAKVETEIKSRFSDWHGAGKQGADPAIHVKLSRGLQTRLFAEAGASSTIHLVWLHPLDPKPTDRVHNRIDDVNSIALALLNRRLQQLATSPARPFLAARAGRGEAERAAELVTMSISYEPGKWQGALNAAEQARLGLLGSGVTQADVDRIAGELHAAHSNASLAAATRATRGLAGQLAAVAADGDIFTSPAQDLAMTDEDLKGLTAAQVNAALKALFTGGGPLIFVSGITPIQGGDQAVRTAFLDSEKQGATAAAPLVADTSWPYGDFGAPGTVAETRQVADLGVTFIRFANGVRLAVRPSKLRANQVLVSVKVGNGRLDLPRDRLSAAWLAGALVQGGLNKIDYTAMQRALAGKSYRFGFGVGEDGMLFSGTTTPGDIDTQLQVLAAYMCDPAFRPEAFEQFKSASVARRKQADAVPGAILQREAPEILHNGDKRWASPSIEEMQAGRVEDVRALLTPVFESGAIDIIIAGDIDAAKATQSVAATFGAFAPRTGVRSVVGSANGARFPAGAAVPIKLGAPTTDDQAIVTLSWPTHGRFPDIKGDAVLQLLSAVMQDRLFAELRGMGAAYVAGMGASSSRVFDYGYLQASAQMKPADLAKFDVALDRIAAEVKEKGVAADELDRAKTPALEELERSRQTNDYWMAVLDGAQEDEHRLDLARDYEAALKSVTAADLQAAARQYLADDRAIKLVVGAQ